MSKIDDVKKAWKELDKEQLALDVVETTVKVVGIGLAAIGTVVVCAVISGYIQQKTDPEGFKREWLEEWKEEFDKLEEENGAE